MKIKEAIDIFYRLYGENNGTTDIAGLEDFEISRHINTAMMLEFTGQTYNPHEKRHDNDTPRRSFEQSSFDLERWKELVVPITLQTDTDGNILYSAIDAFMPTETIRMWDSDIASPDEIEVETRTVPFYHIANMARLHDDKEVPCRFVRHNDIYTHENNHYKMAKDTRPFYTMYDFFLEVRPKATATIKMSIIRQPRHIWYSVANPNTNIDPELSDSVMYDILLRAVQLASVPTDRQFGSQAARAERIEQ